MILKSRKVLGAADVHERYEGDCPTPSLTTSVLFCEKILWRNSAIGAVQDPSAKKNEERWRCPNGDGSKHWYLVNPKS